MGWGTNVQCDLIDPDSSSVRFMLCMHSLVRGSLRALSFRVEKNYVLCLRLFYFLNYFVANTCRYSKTKKYGIEPNIRAERNYYYKHHLKKLIFAESFSFSCIINYTVKIF